MGAKDVPKTPVVPVIVAVDVVFAGEVVVVTFAPLGVVVVVVKLFPEVVVFAGAKVVVRLTLLVVVILGNSVVVVCADVGCDAVVTKFGVVVELKDDVLDPELVESVTKFGVVVEEELEEDVTKLGVVVELELEEEEEEEVDDVETGVIVTKLGVVVELKLEEEEEEDDDEVETGVLVTKFGVVVLVDPRLVDELVVTDVTVTRLGVVVWLKLVAIVVELKLELKIVLLSTEEVDAGVIVTKLGDVLSLVEDEEDVNVELDVGDDVATAVVDNVPLDEELKVVMVVDDPIVDVVVRGMKLGIVVVVPPGPCRNSNFSSCFSRHFSFTKHHSNSVPFLKHRNPLATTRLAAGGPSASHCHIPSSTRYRQKSLSGSPSIESNPPNR